jgi:hypothetical protein
MIYSAMLDGKPILLLCQVDDFALACPNEQLAKCIYDFIRDSLKLKHEKVTPFEYYGLLEEYNGVDVKQIHDSIKISCSQYIHCVL